MAGRAGWGPAQVQRAVEPLVLDFPAEENCCPECRAPLTVLKTHRRRVVTLAQGIMTVREIQKVCRAPVHAKPRVLRSLALGRLVPPHQRYGWDLIVHVGLRRFLFHRQRGEIQQELSQEHGIAVSAGTLSALSDRFLQKLEALHIARAPRLRAAMESEGGYSLHIDSTNETGRGGLFLCLDGFRDWVLHSGTIPSERWESIAPIVDRTVALFGDPIATVQDMSKACARAVAPLTDRGIPNFICHYHFVADIGRDLMRRPHDHIKAHLKIARVRETLRRLLNDLKSETHEELGKYSCPQLAALLYWVLHGDDRRTPRFPFGLPHLELFRRLQSAPSQALSWIPRPWSPVVHRTLQTLESITLAIQSEDRARTAIENLQQRWPLFNELRRILRLEPDPSITHTSHLPEIESHNLFHVETDLKRFEEKLHEMAPDRRRPYSYHSQSPEEIILDHLNRYRRRLFGHPVVPSSDGRIRYLVQRTNNPLEHLFGKNKQELRRRTGRKNLARDLEDLPPQALLVENLYHPRYVALLCGSIANLPQAMATLQHNSTPQTKLRKRSDHDLRTWVKQLSAQYCTTEL